MGYKTGQNRFRIPFKRLKDQQFNNDSHAQTSNIFDYYGRKNPISNLLGPIFYPAASKPWSIISSSRIDTRTRQRAGWKFRVHPFSILPGETFKNRWERKNSKLDRSQSFVRELLYKHSRPIIDRMLIAEGQKVPTTFEHEMMVQGCSKGLFKADLRRKKAKNSLLGTLDHFHVCLDG